MSNNTKKPKLNNHNENNANASRQYHISANVQWKSINDLPKCVTQHILSFDESTDIHMVNKEWYDIFKNLKQIEQNKTRKFITEYTASFHPDFEPDKTVIVDQNRTQLTQNERDSGIYGLYQDLPSALENCISGTKILIYPGVHRMSRDPFGGDRTNYNLQFIGVGNDVYVHNVAIFRTGRNAPQLYFENIKFTELMAIARSGSISMKDCEFDLEIDGVLDPYKQKLRSGHMRMLNTRFLNCHSKKIILYITKGDVEIIGCKFENVNSTKCCIYGRNLRNDRSKIIGNMFHNIACDPLQTFNHASKIVVYGNRLKKENRIVGLNETDINPNMFRIRRY